MRMPHAIALLTIVFVSLKLCGVLVCSWFWVFSPLWLYLLLFLVIWIAIASIDYFID